METSPYRPRVSRETRLLLTAGVLAIATLWLLARVRFPERPVTPNPVPSVLGQLARGPNYDDLAGEIAQLQARLQPSLLTLELPSSAVAPSQTAHRTAAIRLRDDLAVLLVPHRANAEPFDAGTILARDPASGLTIVRVPLSRSTSPPIPWTPRQPQQARYLVASDVSGAGVSLRPVFVGSLDPIASPLWTDPMWAVPRRTDLVPGSFLFTSNGELAGLVMSHGGGLAIVPGETVLEEADRLEAMAPGPPGDLGVEVQDLTPTVAAVTGAPAGVVVTWIEPTGAAKGQLMPGDVIEAVDSVTVSSRQSWDVRAARLRAGEALTLRVRRRGELREVRVTAGGEAPQPDRRSLGLTLRARPGIGAEAVRVDSDSAAARAGLSAGDVITLVGDVSAPTPAQVLRSFAAMGLGQRVLIAVTRGDTHFVTTLDR